MVFQYSITTSKPDAVLPGGQGKVSNYLTSCIEQVASQALSHMGQQAGYVTVPKEVELDGAKHLRTSPVTVAPFWAYGTTTTIPTQDQLKSRLDTYIQTNLRDCVMNSQGLRDSYNILEKSEVSSDAKIHPKGITFSVKWSIEIQDKAGEVITQIDDHIYESNVKLQDLRDLGEKIILAELSEMKLEDLTQDMIALEHPQLPVSGIEFACSKKKWKFDEAKDTLQNMLRVNLAQLQIKGTNPSTPHTADLPYYQNHYEWNIGELSYSKITPQFHYDANYPFSFDVSPRGGNYLQSENLIPKSKYISLLCLQTWKFAYDVTYPIMLTLTDDTTGYQLKIPFTVEMENNYANRHQTIKPNSPILLSTQTSDDYCKTAKTPMLVKTQEIVDNPYTGVHTTQPLDNAKITFVCLKYDCTIGQTEYNYGGMGDVAAINTNFPACVGGYVRSEKPYYTMAQERVIINSNPNQEVTLNSIPLYPVSLNKITIKTHTNSEDGIGPAQDLKDNQVALIKITFDRGNETYNPLHLPNQESSLVVSPLLDEKTKSSQTLDLLAMAEFTYDVDIQVYEDENLISSYRGNWTVPWEDLEYSSHITFHTIQAPTEDEKLYNYIEDLGTISKTVPLPEIQ